MAEPENSSAVLKASLPESSIPAVTLTTYTPCKRSVNGVQLASCEPAESGNDHSIVSSSESEVSHLSPPVDVTIDSSGLADDEGINPDDDDDSDVTDDDHADEQLSNQIAEPAIDGLRLDDGGLEQDHEVGDGLKEGAQPQGEFVAPDEELARAISAQADQLFSDEYVLKESYLLKHIRRNKLGYVSLKVVNSLRKMKRLTKDYRQIAYSLKLHSTLLELNDTETKVRRRDALTLTLPPAPSPTPDDVTAPPEQRTVVAINLPDDKPPTITSVAELFSACGQVAQIRLILSAGSGSPPSLPGGELGRLLSKHLGVGDTSCALVEFERIADVKRACKLLTDKSDWRRGMRVTPLVPPAPTRKHNDSGNNSENGGDRKSGNESGGGGGGAGDRKCTPQRKARKKKSSSRVDELSGSSGALHSYSSGSDTDSRGRSGGGAWGASGGGQRRRGTSPKGASPLLIAALQGGAYRNSPEHSGTVRNSAHDSDNDDWRARTGSFGSDPGTGSSRNQSPWAARRRAQLDAAVGGALGGPGGDTGGTARGIATPPEFERVLRQPRGPDGSGGFKRTPPVRSLPVA